MERGTDDHERIRVLNEEMRKAGPLVGGSDIWMLTPGVRELGSGGVIAAIDAVKAFDTFTSDNDPYGERDFGVFDVAGQRLFWKIDYYDLHLESGSPDPTDSAVTVRVLTVLLAAEY